MDQKSNVVFFMAHLILSSPVLMTIVTCCDSGAVETSQLEKQNQTVFCDLIVIVGEH